MERWLPEIQQVQKLVQFAVRDLNEALNEGTGEESSDALRSPRLRAVYSRRLREVERLVEELSKEYERLLRDSTVKTVKLQQELDEAQRNLAQGGVASFGALDPSGGGDGDPTQQRLLRLEKELADVRDSCSDLTEQIRVERQTHAEELRLSLEGGLALQGGAGQPELGAELISLRQQHAELSRKYDAFLKEHEGLRKLPSQESQDLKEGDGQDRNTALEAALKADGEADGAQKPFVTNGRNAPGGNDDSEESYLAVKLRFQEGLAHQLQQDVEAEQAIQLRIIELETARHTQMVASLQALLDDATPASPPAGE